MRFNQLFRTALQTSGLDFEFAATKRNGPITLHWYDGNKKIPGGKLYDDYQRPAAEELIREQGG